MFPRTPGDHLLANALAEPLDELLLVEVDGRPEADQVLAYVRSLPEPPRELVVDFDGRSRPRDILENTEKWYAEQQDQSACLVLRDISNETYYRSIPSLRNFWRQVNLQRERWASLPGTKLIIVGPRSYDLIQSAAADLNSLAAVRGHLVPDDPVLGPGQDRAHSLEGIYLGGEAEELFRVALDLLAQGATVEELNSGWPGGVESAVLEKMATECYKTFHRLVKQGELHPERYVGEFLVEVVDGMSRSLLERKAVQADRTIDLEDSTSLVSFSLGANLLRATELEWAQVIAMLCDAAPQTGEPLPAWSAQHWASTVEKRADARWLFRTRIASLPPEKALAKHLWPIYPHALVSLPSLTDLDLHMMRVVQVDPIARLTELTRLNLANNSIQDIRPLNSLRQLVALDLSGTDIDDMTPLAELVRLEELNLSRTDVADLTPLARLDRMEVLDLSVTLVSDISMLGNLPRLRALNLAQTTVSDVSALRGLAQLKTLDLSGTRVTDLSPLDGLQNLELKT